MKFLTSYAVDEGWARGPQIVADTWHEAEDAALNLGVIVDCEYREMPPVIGLKMDRIDVVKFDRTGKHIGGEQWFRIKLKPATVQ